MLLGCFYKGGKVAVILLHLDTFLSHFGSILVIEALQEVLPLMVEDRQSQVLLDDLTIFLELPRFDRFLILDVV